MKTISRLLASALILVFSFTAARAINPQKAYAYTPKDFGIEYVEDSVVTSDGYRINIWNLPGSDGKSVQLPATPLLSPGFRPRTSPSPCC